jgi:hypothetical protein
MSNLLRLGGTWRSGLALTAVAIALIACGVALSAPVRATHDTSAAKTLSAAKATNRAFVYLPAPAPGNTKHEEEAAATKKHEEEAAATAAKKHQEEEAAAKNKKEKEEAAQIATLLGRELTPSGKAAKIAALLKSGVFSISFRALEAGTAVINWYQVPPGAKFTKKAKPKPVLVASGQRSFSAAGTTKIKIKLTAAGKRLLKHAKQLKLTAKGTFTPTGKTPITTTKVFVLKR